MIANKLQRRPPRCCNGKTIDSRPWSWHVVLSDGTAAHFRPLDSAQLDAAWRPGPRASKGGVLTGAVREPSQRRAETRSAARFSRKCCGRCRRLQPRPSSSIPPPPFNLSRSSSAPKGRSASSSRPRSTWWRCPRAKAVLTIRVRGAAGLPSAATPPGASPRPVGRRGDGPLHPGTTPRRSPVLDALRRSILQSDPGRPAVRRALRRPRRRPVCRGSRPSNVTWPRLDIAASGRRANRPLPDQARIWSFREASLGLSMADEGRRQVAGRSSRTRAVAPERLRDYIERFFCR